MADYLPIGETKLYYDASGSGETILFLHAGIADSRMWDAQVEALEDRYRVVRCDLRGFGRTVLAPGTFSDRDDVAALLDHLDVPRATIVGASYGGQVALDFVLAYPERTAKLVLLAPAVGGRDPGPDVARFGKQERTLLKAGDVVGAVELNLVTWVDGPKRGRAVVSAEERARIGDMQRHIFDTDIPEGVEEEPLDPPAAARLDEIRVETLVLVGDSDLDGFIEQADWVAETIPNARLISVPNAAHLPNLDAPALVSDVIHRSVGAP